MTLGLIPGMSSWLRAKMSWLFFKKMVSSLRIKGLACVLIRVIRSRRLSFREISSSVALASHHLVSTRFSYLALCWEFHYQVVRRGGCSPCVECRLLDDGIIGKKAIDNEEGDLPGELLRIGANGY